MLSVDGERGLSTDDEGLSLDSVVAIVVALVKDELNSGVIVCWMD